MNSIFNLKVQLIENTCLFELTWGEGQQLNANLNYPQSITNSYHEWHNLYLNFYRKSFRGRVADIGTIAPPPVDYRAKLVEAEAKLLYEFHHWLRSAELYEIRAAITNAIRDETSQSPTSLIDVFLTCNSLELERLPWEAWNIGNEFALGSDKMRIFRKPINISKSTANPAIRRKARILAILGDDTGLGFQAEKNALKSLEKIIHVEYVGWEPGKDINQLKQEIVDKLSSNIGWDILFFAGHSNETNLTGGEIVIAPNTALYLNEIEAPLSIAKNNGLQFLIFNSCSGLSLANKLIDLGFSQVAIMREPIHNQVALEFFIQFSQALAEYKDVSECLLVASEYLKSKNITYPSSYLIPSLFRHPAAPLFRIQPFGFQQFIKKIIPTPLEAIAVSTLALISLQLPVQSWLLEKRILAQAVYRQLTNQIDTKSTPPVLLVQIDNESINKAGILNPRPINREYMAQIIDKLVESKASVIGIDYLLDRPDKNRDAILSNFIKTGLISSQSTRFVFATTRDSQGNWLSVHPQIASEKWSLAGEIEVLPGWYMQLLPSRNSSPKPRPFAYLLALSQQLKKNSNSPQPQLKSKQDFWQQVNTYINNNPNQSTILSSKRTRLQSLTAFSYYLGQMWLHPIIDFSLPPKQVYQTIPAWKLLENKEIISPQQITIVAPGGYGEAGTVTENEDNFELPAATGYWKNQDNPDNTRGVLTGGEIHAYMTHHYLNNAMVIPIPDLWMIGLAILLGKITSEYLRNNPEQHRKNLVLLSVSSAIYSLISLQLYISSAAILLPWLLPTITFWFYVLRAFSKKNIYYE